METITDSKVSKPLDLEIGIDSGVEGVMGIACIGPVCLVIVTPPACYRTLVSIVNIEKDVTFTYSSNEQTVLRFIQFAAMHYQGDYQVGGELPSAFLDLYADIRRAGISLPFLLMKRAFREARQ